MMQSLGSGQRRDLASKMNNFLVDDAENYDHSTNKIKTSYSVTSTIKAGRPKLDENFQIVIDNDKERARLVQSNNAVLTNDLIEIEQRESQ